MIVDGKTWVKSRAEAQKLKQYCANCGHLKSWHKGQPHECKELLCKRFKKVRVIVIKGAKRRV